MESADWNRAFAALARTGDDALRSENGRCASGARLADDGGDPAGPV